MPPESTDKLEVAVLVGALLAEQRHLLVVVDREDEVRRVAGGAAGVGQRALVEQDQVGPAQAGQVADHAVADDAGADDHARWRAPGLLAQLMGCSLRQVSPRWCLAIRTNA